ncbi:MAG: hypothetical protein JJU46_01965 [Balneolaceae bacterium]|nr:hypothetical protein [Balneolaceae bacterium]MCH8547255.1 hypothetical protein [Balneolaceae bacterium]
MSIRELLKSTPFLNIAHRGASHSAPENTLAAFHKAVEDGAHMIELDVQLTSDNHLVVFHDDDLQRIFGIPGSIREITLDELKQLDAGSWFDSRFSSEKVPTLEKVLAEFYGVVPFNMELKVSPFPVDDDQKTIFAEKVCDTVRQCGMEQSVLFSTFDHSLLIKLKKTAPEIARSVLIDRSDRQIPLIKKAIEEADATALHTHWFNSGRLLINEMNLLDLPILVYTVNYRWHLKKMIRKGVKGVFTNRPERLSKLL